MSIPVEVIESRIRVLEYHAGTLRGAVDAERAWADARPDSIHSTAVDRQGQERMEALTARALYDIWEGTALKVRLEGSHEPWVVELVDHQIGIDAKGVSWEWAANALLEAIVDAIEQLRATIP